MPMSMNKYLTAAVLGVVGLSSGALANTATGASFDKPKDGATALSSADCSVISISDASVSVEQARADAAASTAAFICGEGTADAYAAASATAHAFAIAIAEVSASCILEGDAAGTAYGFAAAQVDAQVWLDAYAEATSAAFTCDGQCEAFTSSFAYVGKDVFLSAYAAAEASINAYSNDPITKVQQAYQVSVDIEEAIVTAFAESISYISNVYDVNDCYAWGNAEGCIYTEEGPQCASCQVESVGYSDVETIDAIATATASATALACGNTAISIASASAYATAIAEAWAVAVSLIYINCQADEGGYACASADSYVEETAFATAEAVASAWAGAVSCGGCYIGEDDFAQALGSIFVEASSSAWGSLCADGGEYWSLFDFQEHIVGGYVEAIAEACVLAVAVQPPGECLAVAVADASLN